MYILQCQNGSYYTGHTNDLERRLRQHSTGVGGARYTKAKKVGELVWSKEYVCFKHAFDMERRIKSLARKQKEMIVSGARPGTILKEAGK